MKPKNYIFRNYCRGMYCPQLSTNDLLVTYPAVFAEDYMVLHSQQSMWLFANGCRYCEVHIYGGSIRLRVRSHSHICVYLNFEVYISLHEFYYYIW